jgi:hypothetical protein
LRVKAWGAIQTEVVSQTIKALVLTRHGDWGMRICGALHQISWAMRFAKVKEEIAQRAGDTQQSVSPN